MQITDNAWCLEVKKPVIFARGQGQRNCGTYHGHKWKEIMIGEKEDLLLRLRNFEEGEARIKKQYGETDKIYS